MRDTLDTPNLVTWRQAAKKHFETLEKLQVLHTKKFSGTHPHYCMNPPLWVEENKICQAIDVIQSDIEKIRGNEP